jgi:hypothetical protein
MEPIQESREPQRLYAPSRSSQRGAGAQNRTAAAPWTADHPWKPAGQEPDYSADARGSLRGQAVLLAVIVLANLAFAAHSHLLENLAVILDLFGAVILFDLLLRLWQSTRRTRMRWTTFPAFTGGRLEGVLTPRPALEPVGAVRTVLRCVRDQRGAEPTVIYQQISEINVVEDRLKELPLSFAIPADLPGTDLGQDEPIYWQVALRIPIVGPDFETVFLAPVYRC